MNEIQEMKLEIDSNSRNESFARMVVAAFATRLNPTLEEIADIKTAVSEAVTNSILHGYQGGPGKVWISCRIEGHTLHIEIVDKGVGIEDIEKAMEPLYTTRSEWERSGMGFSFMEAFMDHLEVVSGKDDGTTIRMVKSIGT